MLLLDEENDFKFVARKWNIVNDQSNANCGIESEIIYNTDVLRSNLCDYNNACILVRGDITFRAAPETQVAFKTLTPFTKCITKIDGTAIDYAEDLDIVMPMYNLIEYMWNYSETALRLWFYSKDEATNCNADVVNDNNVKCF